MGLFDFVKGIGKKNTAAPVQQPHNTAQPTPAPAAKPVQSDEPTAQEMANRLLGLIKSLGFAVEGLSVTYNGSQDLATIKGQVKSQADREKIVLVVGNVDHVAKVDDQMTVMESAPASQFYTVKAGDTLSKIAQQFYGDDAQYQKIFQANQPMLKDPDEIFPGQTLRIPQ